MTRSHEKVRTIWIWATMCRLLYNSATIQGLPVSLRHASNQESGIAPRQLIDSSDEPIGFDSEVYNGGSPF